MKQVPKRKTHEEFLQEAKEKNDYLEILGTYLSSKAQIEVRCRKCGKTYFTLPRSVLNGNPCYECSMKINGQKNALTHNEFVDKLKEISPCFEVIGVYKRSKEKIECKCLKCQNTFFATPNNLLRGQNCSCCTSRKDSKKLTNDIFVKRLKDVNSDITPISEYINSTTKIKCRCNLCNKVIEMSPKVLLRGQGCWQCGHAKAGISARKTHADFVEDMRLINPNLEFTSQYQTNKVHIGVRCKKCGNEWKARPDSLLQGKGCPHCNVRSKGELACSNYFDINNIAYEGQKTFSNLKSDNNYSLRYDFFLPDYNLLIEYQGQQHEMPIEYFGGEEKFMVQTKYDNQKREFAKENGYDLLEISYKDYKNIASIIGNYLNYIERRHN